MLVSIVMVSCNEAGAGGGTGLVVGDTLPSIDIDVPASVTNNDGTRALADIPNSTEYGYARNYAGLKIEQGLAKLDAVNQNITTINETITSEASIELGEDEEVESLMGQTLESEDGSSFLWNEDTASGYQYVRLSDGTNMTFYIQWKENADGTVEGLTVQFPGESYEDKTEFKVGGTGVENYIKYRMRDDNAGVSYYGYDLILSADGSITLGCSEGSDSPEAGSQDKYLVYAASDGAGALKMIKRSGAALDSTSDQSYVEVFTAAAAVSYSKCTLGTGAVLSSSEYTFPTGTDENTSEPTAVSSIPSSFTYGDSGDSEGTYSAAYSGFLGE